MPRGGKRTGTPGTAYANRSDLNRPATGVPTPTYGDKAAQQRAQQAIPLPEQSAPPAPQQRVPVPGERGAFDRDTERPGEVISSGLPIGPGPGPSALMPAVDPALEALRKAMRVAPNNRIQDLIEAIEAGR